MSSFILKNKLALELKICFSPRFESNYQKLLLEAKRKLGEILSAFEFLDNQSLDLVSSRIYIAISVLLLYFMLIV